MKNKKFIISLIVLIVVIGCIFSGLWYMNNRNNVDSDNLVFDESKIVNKNTDYSYALDLDDSEKIMGNNGNQYYFI